MINDEIDSLCKDIISSKGYEPWNKQKTQQRKRISEPIENVHDVTQAIILQEMGK